MIRGVQIAVLALAALVAAHAQTTRVWTSNSDDSWSRNGNWSSSNRPNANNEVAEFGSGRQRNPELDANNYKVRGIRFSSSAGSYDVGDDNGNRTLKIGNSSSGFIQSLSARDQTISIATLSFQSDATISTVGSGTLTLASRLTGNNRDLTFSTASDIFVSGAITTGNGTLTKTGAADLHLAGANTYAGTTTISAGRIVAEASNVFGDSSLVSVAGGAALGLNGHSEIIGRLGGSGTVDLGAAGTGRLTLASGYSSFSGNFSGSGELVIGSGATLSLGAGFSNANLKITLAGGTLRLNGSDVSFGALSVTGNSVIDFASGDGTVDVDSVSFGSSEIELSLEDWTDAADYFFSQTAYAQGQAPLDQMAFAGWSTNDTKWQSYDRQVTPVPEAGCFGVLLLAAGSGLLLFRRRRQERACLAAGEAE
jgi:autotransporter-associated beta strand protein